MNHDFLNKIFKLCEISDADAKLLTEKLFKYRDDYVVNATCAVINTLQSHISRFYELWKEVAILPFPVESAKPLIILSPDNTTSLRIYPNIIINGSVNSDISSINCGDSLKDFLTAYEADLLDVNRAKKWQEDTATKRLQEYIDMPTARAISRYIFPANLYRDDQIRDFADAFDNLRKPMELSFADTPEDFTVMYGSGPQSCMSYSAEGKSHWSFLGEQNWCPGSWYAFYPYTRGCFVIKNKKVLARVILFKDHKTDAWYYGRVYATTQAIEKKFKDSLAESNIKALIGSISTPPEGFEFIIPGIKIKNAKEYGCPWPYFDNLPRGTRNWGIKFDATTNEFTIQYMSTKYPNIYNRTGHILSSDYTLLECDNCGKRLSRSDRDTLLPTEGGTHVLCSDDCAASLGYIRQIDGTGNTRYCVPSEHMVPTYLNDFVRFSTLKAAYDCGYYPVITEFNLFPEETDFQVSNRVAGRYVSTQGDSFATHHGADENVSNRVNFVSSIIPIKLNPAIKLVEFDTESELVAA